jgi:hypothetical protein
MAELRETTRRQRILRARDKASGIKGLKLRCTENESNMIDTVRAALSMTRAEACMALFFEKAKILNIPVVCQKPEVRVVCNTRDSETARLLNELVELTGAAPANILADALKQMKASLY